MGLHEASFGVSLESELSGGVVVATISMDAVGKVYPDGTRAVGDVNIEIDDGEFLVLVGPSGCGKSTLLRMVAGLEEITDGTISIDDNVINDVVPKDRDIAMIFQNYALYPHMSVYENMAFGLKLRKLPKAEIDETVRDAAEILEITELLDRKPKALSGGQRQRVAMGRAIVRTPKAFLMDEPLSNLDAKLRVQMRSEIGQLHDRLGTTTIYVTHDQVEAMTLGTRVAVMKPVTAARPNNLQQVASPSELYNNPVNLFVAGFIGSPAMNMAYGTFSKEGDDVLVTFAAGFKVRLAPEAVARHTGLDAFLDKEVVVGIRPGDFEAADIAGESEGSMIEVHVTLAERLGAETFVHSKLNSPPVLTPDIEELLADAGQDASSLGDTVGFTARVSPDARVVVGETIRLVVDSAKMHFFDPETGLRIT